MTDMKPEELKIIAEGMGYKAAKQPEYNDSNWRTGFVLLIYDKNKTFIEYNPLTNDTQCMEIMEKLKSEISYNWRDGWVVRLQITIKTQFGNELSSKRIFGKTINEAVCKAAYEYFKDRA
jgi:hypothetical protein